MTDDRGQETVFGLQSPVTEDGKSVLLLLALSVLLFFFFGCCEPRRLRPIAPTLNQAVAMVSNGRTMREIEP
jgi:hypothetical protein